MQVFQLRNNKESIADSLKGVNDAALQLFISSSLITTERKNTAVLSVNNRFSIDNLPNPSQEESRYLNIVNFEKANDIVNLSNLFSSVNNRLKIGGKFITCLETAKLRKLRLYRKYPAIISHCYYGLDFLGKRVIPKIPIADKIYFFLTANRNRVLTSVEVLGRLVYCGFRIAEVREINGLLYISAEKMEDKIDLPERKYGLLFRMQRTGFQGKIITVYKLRTMNPYSEYLQEYIYSKNNLAKGGKINDDYRVNIIGRVCRKLWLDELPMIYNLLRREIKLVGVRPLSAHFLSLYSKELVKRREKHRPGLIPPYYADMPETIEEIMASEMRYFDAFERSPWKTDAIYFFKALKNILIKKARSN